MGHLVDAPFTRIRPPCGRALEEQAATANRKRERF